MWYIIDMYAVPTIGVNVIYYKHRSSTVIGAANRADNHNCVCATIKCLKAMLVEFTKLL